MYTQHTHTLYVRMQVLQQIATEAMHLNQEAVMRLGKLSAQQAPESSLHTPD